MNKCEHFCNGHCAYDCPNFAIDGFEDKYDLPCSEIGMSRIKCSECQYNGRNMTCKDCYFFNTPECPEYAYNQIVKEWVHSEQYPGLADNWREEFIEFLKNAKDEENDRT